MIRKEGSRPYRAYLLRCWQEERPAAGEDRCWRFLVEEVLQQGPQQGFDDLDGLVAFLRAELTDEGNESVARARPGGSNEGGGDCRHKE